MQKYDIADKITGYCDTSQLCLESLVVGQIAQIEVVILYFESIRTLLVIEL